MQTGTSDSEVPRRITCIPQRQTLQARRYWTSPQSEHARLKEAARGFNGSQYHKHDARAVSLAARTCRRYPCVECIAMLLASHPYTPPRARIASLCTHSASNRPGFRSIKNLPTSCSCAEASNTTHKVAQAYVTPPRKAQCTSHSSITHTHARAHTRARARTEWAALAGYASNF